MNAALRDLYATRYHETLKPIEEPLRELIHDHLAGEPRIDRISVRAKSVDRFIEKASKMDGERARYEDPLAQVQDQIGARIIVFYKSDVVRVRSSILKYFTHIEEVIKEPSKDDEFGYFGFHYILRLPLEAVPRQVLIENAPPFFELQIKTLYQHAWSEANHDLAYKGSEEGTREQTRLRAFVAAQSWGADRIFDDLAARLLPGFAQHTD